MDERWRLEVEAFLRGAWGDVLREHVDAKGMCERASLALLARFERAGVTDVDLWLLSQEPSRELPADRWAGAGATHMVLAHGGTAIDVSVRQFASHEDDELPRIEPLEIARSRWNTQRIVRPDEDAKFLRGWIPPNWRDLADADPPGEIPNWPYARPTLDPRSRFYRP